MKIDRAIKQLKQIRYFESDGRSTLNDMHDLEDAISCIEHFVKIVKEKLLENFQEETGSNDVSRHNT